MIKSEDYVSLEVAKMLKEKGFDEPCEYYISENTGQVFYKGRLKPFKEEGHIVFLCPTLYEAQKWLRQSKCIHIEVIYMIGNYWIYEMLTIPHHNLTGASDRGDARYENYEKALNAGILEALKLI